MTEPTEPTPIPWYRRPGVLAGLAVAVLAAGVGVGLFLAAGEGDGGNEVDTVDTTVPTSPPSTALPPPTTTPASVEDQCGDGDQVACDQLTDDQLGALCDEGNVDACQVLLARQGDGATDGDGDDPGNGNNGNDNGDDDDD